MSERDAEAALQRGAGSRRQLHRHGGRLRRWAQSETLIARVLKSRGAKRAMIVATKAGQQTKPHVNAEGYKTARTGPLGRAQPDQAPGRSRRSTWCSCTARRTRSTTGPRSSPAWTGLVKAGKIKALRRQRRVGRRGDARRWNTRSSSVQIIFNMFRQRPAELFFDRAQKKRRRRSSRACRWRAAC